MHRTFSVPRLVAWWSTFAALFLQIGISAASAQSLIPSAPVAQSQQTAPQNSVIELAVGASRPYQMTTRADFKRVENPNSKVLRVERSGDKNNEVILVAENPGRTLVTFVDQQDRVELHEIVVQPNGEQPKTADTPGVLTLVTGVPRTYQAREPYSAIVSRDSKKLRAQVVKPGPGAKGFEEFILEGLEPGRASFTIFFGDKKERQETYEVLIEADRVRQLRELIAKTLPTAAITVTSADSSNTIVLTGTVLTTDDLRLVQNIVANMGAGIVNNVRIGGVQQVQLEVVVAIVNRTEARRMAFSWNVNGPNWFASSILGGPFTVLNGLAAAPGAVNANLSQTGGANLPFGILGNNSSFMGFLQALRTEGVVKIMSEPRVTTLSGRPAYIVSGGETPILTSSGQGAPAVSYKQFGTVVHCLPVVLGNGKIHLEVRPEISEPDPNLNVTIAGIVPTVVPGFRTRSAQAAVQIEDGQTVAIGGLIQNRVEGTISRVPVLGDIPFLGVAFSQKVFTESEEEMIILVTPRLIDPIDCTKFPRYLPGRETRAPDDFELFLEGILEAPRGPRNVVFHPHLYKGAHTGAPNWGQVPCGDVSGHGGRHGLLGGGCADGNCGVANNPALGRPTVYGTQNVTTSSVPSPRFPESTGVQQSNFRLSVESEMPSSAPMPPMRTNSGLGPVTPTQGMPLPMPSGNQPDSRQSLPQLMPSGGNLR